MLSEKTSRNLRALMRLVVLFGTGRKADVPGYLVGGKTGTAEKQVNGRYEGNKLFSNFVGAFPIDAPRYVIMAAVDEPKGNAHTYGYASAGWVAAPIINRIVARMAPLVGIEPGVKPAAAASRSGRICVLTTTATARSERLARLIRQHAAHVEVDVLPCPGWATKVESLHLDDPAFAAGVRQHLAATLDAGADQIVLGCTHYTFLTPMLKPIVEGRATLVDVAEAVARQCVRLAGSAAQGHGQLTLLSTAQPERLQAALPAFGLTRLIARQAGPARLALV